MFKIDTAQMFITGQQDGTMKETGFGQDQRVVHFILGD